jgi:hypothetical protein
MKKTPDRLEEEERKDDDANDRMGFAQLPTC